MRDSKHASEAIQSDLDHVRKSASVCRKLFPRPAADIQDPNGRRQRSILGFEKRQEILIHPMVALRLVVEMRYLVVINPVHRLMVLSA